LSKHRTRSPSFIVAKTTYSRWDRVPAPTGPPILSERKASYVPERQVYRHDTHVNQIILRPYQLWALVIGINTYSNKQRLNGAVADANAITQYLETTLKVPNNHIVNLRDEGATRSNIISAFEGLRDNDGIEKGDPILIYYAGHGGKVPREDADIAEALIPVDYAPGQVYPIPDRTIASLINGISNKHGNNIVRGSLVDPGIKI
jgi:hypothetical protein